MNPLLQGRLAEAGDEPAITKVHMKHQLGPHMSLVDTPGMLWPGVTPDVGLKLAATHSISRNAYDDASVAVELGQYLLQDYLDQLTARYGAIPAGADGHGLLAAIAARRAFLGKGGAPDLDKAASILLKEFRDGVLGAIPLETPAQVAERQRPTGRARAG